MIRMKRIVLVGLGPHAKRIYFPYISQFVENSQVDFSYLIDLQSKEDDIKTFLADKTTQPKHIRFVPDKDQRIPTKLDSHLCDELEIAIKRRQITHAVISTEPKAHKIYAEFFISHKIPVLIDKPLTAPVNANCDIDAAAKIYQDFLDLYLLSKKHNTPIYVQSQRREHPLYMYLFDLIAKTIRTYKIPITYFDIYHSDGTWNMPDDFVSRENHPYKYGYGKLLHSGYHFVDILAWLIETQAAVFGDMQIDNFTSIMKPAEQFYQLNSHGFLDTQFGVKIDPPSEAITGEVDTYSTFKVYDKIGKMLTFGRMDLLQGGFTQRGWLKMAKDTYKGNGRIRHERLNIHIGPIMNIQLHSYQSDQVTLMKGEEVGHEDHLELHIYRNKSITGKPAFEIVKSSDLIPKKDQDHKLYIGQNEVPRLAIFEQFLAGNLSGALIDSQDLTNKLLSDIYISIATNKVISSTYTTAKKYVKNV